MSAKVFYHKDTPPYTPRIPPELWAAIIESAAEVPYGLDPEFMSLQLGISATKIDKERLHAWQVALVTKRSMVRVNKMWYRLASPFLYEYIILGRSRALAPLLSGMERSKQAADSQADSPPPIGWWTQRLDVNMRDSPNGNPQITMNALAGILRHLSNLRILTFSITGHRFRPTLPSNVLRSVACPNTLKVVHWYTHHFPSMTSWSQFLIDHPHVESVNTNEIMNSALPKVHLDSLTTVHVHGIGFVPGELPTMTSHMWSMNLPAVRYATYDVEFSSNDIELVQAFFGSLGKQLLVIQLVQVTTCDDMDFAVNVDVTFEEMCNFCVVLKQVNFLFLTWGQLDNIGPPILPDTVKKIVIRIVRSQLPRARLNNFFHSTLCGIIAQNPNVKTVQFYSKNNVRHLHRHPFSLKEGLRLMQSIDVTILDDAGNRMLP